MIDPPASIGTHTEAVAALDAYRQLVLAHSPQLKDPGWMPDWAHPDLPGPQNGLEARIAVARLARVSGPGHAVFVSPAGREGFLVGVPAEGRPRFTVHLPGGPYGPAPTATPVDGFAQVTADLQAVAQLRIRLTECAALDLANRRHREAGRLQAEAAGLSELTTDLELVQQAYAAAFLARWRQIHTRHHPTPRPPVFRPATIRKELR